jgi:hypothetical protein
MTAVLGSILLLLVVIVALTGFLSHAAYQPDLGRNALVGTDLPFTTFFDWPTGPVVALRAHTGAARQRRADRAAGAAGEALVGDPAAVPVSACANARRGDRAHRDQPARWRAPASCSRPAW